MQNEKRFDALAWSLYRAGLRPDHLTYLQAPLMALMGWVGWYSKDHPTYLYAFAALQVLVVVLDGADGVLARRTGSVTRRGHLLDSLFDVLGIGVTLWVAFHLYPRLAQWLLLLLLVNFLLYVQNEIQGTKAVTYTRGPVTLGLLLEPYLPGMLQAGVLLPLLLGAALLATRLDWRKRLWNYYQFFTAGQRRAYKSVPKSERAGLALKGQTLPARKADADGSASSEPSGEATTTRRP